jgi:hypothetical protein
LFSICHKSLDDYHRIYTHHAKGIVEKGIHALKRPGLTANQAGQFTVGIKLVQIDGGMDQMVRE